MVSLGYTLFLPAVILAAALAQSRAWMPVLGASLAFAFWQAGPQTAACMLAAGFLTWRLCGALESGLSEGRKLGLLWAGILLNLAPLIGFKYVGNWAALGISYFAFNAIASLCDAYFRTAPREASLGLHLLGLFFFPKFIQGPVERPLRLAAQWPQLGKPSYAQLRLGAVLLAWGLFKKLVVAERLGSLVDPVFADLAAHAPAQRLLATYLFAGQLFCDFSGYTDMALGSASLLGISLTQNFDGPFLAGSMADFWRRWHLSLSTWIRDYVFEPLQMLFRNWGLAGTAAAIFLAFFAMGVWHGAAWGYAVFGLLHGAAMALQILWAGLWKGLRKKFSLPKEAFPGLLGWVLTFHFVVFSFVFFRAAGLGDALLALRSIPAGFASIGSWTTALGQGPGRADALVGLLGLALVTAAYFVRKRLAWEAVPAPLRWAAYHFLAVSVIFGGRFFAAKQFIYAQF